MIAALLLMTDEVRIAPVDSGIGDELSCENVIFRTMWPPDDGLLFYDWIAHANKITGLELHILEEPELYDFHAFLASRPYVSCSPFPTIWLQRQQIGESLGCEEFGDVAIMRSDRGTWGIFVPSIPQGPTDI